MASVTEADQADSPDLPDTNPTPDSSRRRRWPLVAALIALLILIAGAAVLGSAILTIKAKADAAASRLADSQKALLDGDLAGARTAAQDAKASVAEAQSAAANPAVRALEHVPVLGGAVDDVDHLLNAAANASDAGASVVGLYAQVKGADGTPAILRNDTVDLERLAALGPEITRLDGLLTDSVAQLDQVNATLPGTGPIASARDSAKADIAPLQVTVHRLAGVWTQLPDALGANGPRTYLLAVLNPAELFPGGGAALGVAALRFDQGKLTVPVKGSVSEIFPGNTVVPWEHVVGEPYFPVKNGTGSFAWAGEHPDFTMSGIEMLRSWQALTGTLPDGIVAVDPIALSAALRSTGPIESDGYGTLTSDNLVQALLIDSYQKYGQEWRDRHNINRDLMTAMISRLSGGSGALSILSEMSSTAPGRHFRMYMSDPTLQQAIAESGWSGAMTTTTGDLVNTFSLDQNFNKVSVFQQRATDQRVTLSADGGATVVRTVTVTNDAPREKFDPKDRYGYTTKWAYNHYDMFLPKAATVVTTAASGPPTVTKRYTDVAGWPIVRMSNWLEPGQSTTLTVTYTLPAGTFSGDNGSLDYTYVAEPQPMVTTPTLNLTVVAPDGYTLAAPEGWNVTGSSATLSAPINRTREGTVRATPGG